MNSIAQNVVFTCVIYLLSGCNNRTEQVDIETCFINKFKEMNAVIDPYEYKNRHIGSRKCYKISFTEKSDLYIGWIKFCVQTLENKQTAKEKWMSNFKSGNADYFKAPEYMVLHENKIYNITTFCANADNIDTVFTVLSSCFEENNVQYDDMIHALCGGRVVE